MGRTKGSKNKLISTKELDIVNNPEEYDNTILRTYKPSKGAIVNNIVTGSMDGVIIAAITATATTAIRQVRQSQHGFLLGAGEGVGFGGALDFHKPA